MARQTTTKRAGKSPQRRKAVQKKPLTRSLRHGKSAVAHTPVKCRHDAQGAPDAPKPRALSKGAGDQVEWSSDEAMAFIVRFDKGDGTPFADDVFHVPRCGRVSSGRITTETFGTYRYSLTDENGAVKDPELDIRR